MSFVDFSKQTEIYSRVETSTETKEELLHRLWVEKFKLIAISFGLVVLFVVLVLMVFVHDDSQIQQFSLDGIKMLGAGFVGYIVKR